MRILVFGDSIAVGAFDTENNGWVSLLTMYQYERILATKWQEGDSVVNVSVSGHTTIDLLGRIEAETRWRRWHDEPFVSLLAMGTNDAALVNGVSQVSLPQFERNVRAIVATLQAWSEHVIIIGLPPVYEPLSSPWCFDASADWKNSELEIYDTTLQKIAQEHHLTFIPLQDVLDRHSDQHLPDGLHPNAEGHRLIYERVKGTLIDVNVL